jgi:mannose-1-phosphate guanylyltransferase
MKVMLPETLESYLAELAQALAAVDRDAILALAEALMRARREGRQVLLMGNGGSAALASHMANDLNKLVVPGQARWRALSLTDNVPLLTAWANDVAYDQVFAEQLRNLCRPGDLVIAVSCSGNSANVLEGLRVAREIGASTSGLTGDEGGCLADMVDLCVRAPARRIGQQEDLHMVLDHLLAVLLRGWIEEIARRAARPPRALVLAAGEGTRLRPITLNTPKAMVPVDGQPLLAHILAWLARHSIREVAINLHHFPEAITDFFGDGSATGMRITYSYESELLGTAGAARRLEGYLRDGPFLVVYGDVLTDLDLGALLEFHHERAVAQPGTVATLALYRVPNPTEVGLVGLDGNGRITRFLEKPGRDEVFTDLANAGVLVAEPSVLDQIPDREFSDFGMHVLPKLLAAGAPLYGWPIPDSTYLLDIGSSEKYLQAQREWPVRSRKR